ncbi:MAG: response regulator, partial [Methylococcaceae bacterium]
LDTRTAFVIAGLLYTLLPIVTWLILAKQRNQGVKLWCIGGILVSTYVVLIGMRGTIPVWASFTLANLLGIIGLLMRMQALRLVLGIPWRVPAMVLVTLLFILTFEILRNLYPDGLYRVTFVLSIITLSLLHIVYIALRIAKEQVIASQSAKWIARSYIFIVCIMLFRIVQLWTGASMPDTGIHSPAFIMLPFTLIVAAVFSHIGYIGLALDQAMQRGEQLQHHRAYLEQEVSARTQELSEKNTSLEIAIQDAISAKKQAEAANKSKSQFLANMSHEIRTPMHGVLGMAELLLSTTLTEKQRRFAEAVHNSGESLLSIINDILDFSKIEAGRFELENLDFNLHRIIEDVIELFAEKAHSKNLELGYRITSGVPEGINGDPTRIRQVLSNLVDNAIKFTGHGEIVVDVSLDDNVENFTLVTDAERLRICFTVRDTGIGINEAVLPCLFQAFSQADGSTTRKYGGTGLGLAISKQLVELMGGEISVDSHASQGSTFLFSLPLRVASCLELNRSSEPSELAGLKLLIVESNVTNLDILQNHALSWGMSVDAVSNALSALELLRKPTEIQSPYDLLIIDMKMAGMNGLELGQHIKADPKLQHIPLIMLTSTLFKGEVAETKKTGFAAYLTKPIRKATLYQCLLNVLMPDTRFLESETVDASGIVPTRLTVSILLAEDNPVNQEVAMAMLQGFGYSVDIAYNGMEALQAVERKAYDLVLMDCMMTEMDGYTATAEIRRRQNVGQLPHFPIIALTANAIEGDREQCLIAGMDDYLTKPFNAESLQRVIKSWVQPSPASIIDTIKPTSTYALKYIG